jgi:NAD(P)-dependent dehydrogenase (short-subunit alcohol dehydrogenase family)
MGLTGEWEQPTVFAYRASKAALNMLTKYTDVALRDKGVTAVAIHPGAPALCTKQHRPACFSCINAALCTLVGSKPAVMV